MRLGDLSIKAKLYGLTIISAVGLMIVLDLAIWSVATFRVNGPVYQNIARDKDLVADILPPPMYVAEADLVLHEADETKAPEDLAKYKRWMDALQKNYDERRAHWQAELPDDELKTVLLQQSYEPAAEFFRVAREEYFPARERGDAGAATALLEGKLHTLFTRHREAITKAVDLATARTHAAEADAATRVGFWMKTMLAVSVAAVVGLTLASWSIARNIVRSTSVLIARVEELANGNGDLSARVSIDSGGELRRLAEGINATIAKMEAIVERTRVAEEEAAHLRNLLRNIIDSMPSSLVGVDPEARITEWNREAERITGISGSVAKGKRLEDVFPQLAAQMGKVLKAVQDKVVQRSERIAFPTAEGDLISDLTVYPLIANGVRGAVVRIDDVTGRVRLEEMMLRSEKMNTVAGLAAGMAHEINNPLAGMMQNAEVVLSRIRPEHPPNQKAAEESGTTMDAVQAYMLRRGIPAMLEAVRSSGERAAGIIANMLHFSRSNPAELEVHDLPKLLDQTIELASSDFDLKKEYDFKNIEVVREYASDLPGIPCRETEIQQAILNILKNAAQAMPGRGVRRDAPRISIRARRDGENVAIEIEDNGPGMPEDVRRQVFEPFFTTRLNVGTGLGLFIAYFIVTGNHQGTIRVDSTPGSGTRFSMTLPMRKEASR